MQELIHDHVGKFGRPNSPLGIVPGVAEVERAEQHHRVDFLGSLDDLAVVVELENEAGNQIDDPPLERLDRLLIVLAEEGQIVENQALLLRRTRIEIDDGADRCAELVERTLDLVAEALERGAAVKLSGFGVFQVRAKRARMGRNPKTGEPAAIEPRRVIGFRASQVMKARIERAPTSAQAFRSFAV